MDYIERGLEQKFLRLNSFFKALLVTGARQVGKTTMLKHLAKDLNRTYVSLDDHIARDLAKADPVMFFQTYKPPVIVDEVQYAPELFGRIKVLCDESDNTGLFWLTGSHQYNMIKNIRESLAGRIGIFELYSLTRREKLGIKHEDTLDFSLACLQKRRDTVLKTPGSYELNSAADVFAHIWQGGMPRLITANSEERNEYFNAYINSYLMRDAAEQGGITDTLRFGKFLTAAAALSGGQLNYKTLADTADISGPTAKDWLNLLAGMGIIYLLHPYANNSLKRLAKTPKLYFCDTGLAAYLAGWPSPLTLQNGAASGHYFENHVVIELLKNYAYSEEKADMTYYRDANAKEIDIFIKRGNLIHPIEIKKTASPSRSEIKKFSVLEKADISRGCGGVICMCEEPVPIDGANTFIPCGLI